MSEMKQDRAPVGLRTFEMLRERDQSGVSGTGVVLQGVVFATGKTVINWLTPAPSGSLNIWDSFDLFMRTHVLPHPGNGTRIEFDDGEVIEA